MLTEEYKINEDYITSQNKLDKKKKRWYLYENESKLPDNFRSWIIELFSSDQLVYFVHYN